MFLEFYIFKLPQNGLFSLGNREDDLIFGIKGVYSLTWLCVGLHYSR